MKLCRVSNLFAYFVFVGFLTLVRFVSFRNSIENVAKKWPVLTEVRFEHELVDTTVSKIEQADCQHVTNKLNAARVNPDNPELIRLLRDCYIDGPSQLPYNLSEPLVRDTSQGQAAVVDKTLGQMDGGFFIDCGANDGEGFSNSLFLERYRNWTGILIEANPTVYKELKNKNRRAFTLNACLNSKPYPSAVTFLEDSWWGNIVEGNYSKTYKGKSRKGRYVQVQCFPLYSILLALNKRTVDYFSLDVEGAEEMVLNSIPWNKLEIKMMSIEYDKFAGGKDALKAYMERKGYKFITEIRGKAAADIVVINETIKHFNS